LKTEELTITAFLDDGVAALAHRPCGSGVRCLAE
jgi:hypothetical protein